MWPLGSVRLRVAADVGKAIQPTGSRRYDAGELSRQRVVGAGMVIVEPSERICAMTGLAEDLCVGGQ